MKECVRFAPMIGARECELTPGEAKALTAHLAECKGCRATLAAFEATDGLVAESLLARANSRDFGPFVDEVLARVSRGREASPAARGGILAWLGGHRRAAMAAFAPVVAALAVVVYVRVGTGPREIALLEIDAEGEAVTVLQTVDGPVVLLSPGAGS